MSHAGTRESPLYDLLRWAERVRGDYASSIRIARSMMLPSEPQTVGYLLDNVDAIIERKTNCTEASRSSYRSRVISCCCLFMGTPRHGGWHAHTFGPAPIKLSRQEQISEALESLVRWPDLQPYLLPALATVVQAFQPPICEMGQPPSEMIP